MRASAILVSLSVLVSACGAATPQQPETAAAIPTPDRATPRAIQADSQAASDESVIAASTPVGTCVDARAEDTSVSRSQLASSSRPEYPDRRAVEALDTLALVIPVDYQARGAVIRLPTDSFFEAGTADLTPNARWRLDEIATALAQQYGRDIVIRGFTDGLGDPEECVALSQRRAMAIRDYVVSKGADAQQIRVEGLGQKNPVGDNATASGRSNNRRIEIVVAKRNSSQI